MFKSGKWMEPSDEICYRYIQQHVNTEATQLLWLEMALLSKKALHNVEKHS